MLAMRESKGKEKLVGYLGQENAKEHLDGLYLLAERNRDEPAREGHKHL